MWEHQDRLIGWQDVLRQQQMNVEPLATVRGLDAHDFVDVKISLIDANIFYIQARLVVVVELGQIGFNLLAR